MKIDRLDVYLYPVFRVIIGLMFFTHGASKVLGWFGGSSLSVFSLMGFVGLMEILGGLAIAIGVFARAAALGGALLMVLAYFNFHFPEGVFPMYNGGELAVLYFAAFLVIFCFGAGKWSLERKLIGRELFGHLGSGNKCACGGCFSIKSGGKK